MNSIGFMRTRPVFFSLGRFGNRNPWSVHNVMITGSYSLNAVDPVMLAIMQSDGDRMGNYIQGRLNLYDLFDNDPANNVEPYSWRLIPLVGEWLAVQALRRSAGWLALEAAISAAVVKRAELMVTITELHQKLATSCLTDAERNMIIMQINRLTAVVAGIDAEILRVQRIMDKLIQNIFW